MKSLVCAGVAAALLGTTAVTPAKAWGGGGFVVGTAVGLGVGAAVGASLVRPYPYYYGPYGYPYPYYAAPYPYYYPAPPVVYAPPPAPASPPAGTSAGRASYAPPAPTSRTLPCRPGQFFNTLTGSCDTR